MYLRSIAVTFLFLLVGCGGSGGSAPATPPPVVITPPAPVITGFSYSVSQNPSLSQDVTLDINGEVISGRVTTNIPVDQLVASFQHTGLEVLVGNVVQVSGASENDFTNEIIYTVRSSDGQTNDYTVDVTKFTGLPIIYLTTNNNVAIDSKEDYVTGTVVVDGGRDFSSSDSAIMEIRGRGNSTWFVHPKKPYQMKLDDDDTMLGMPAEKKWLFLAEYSDKTMLRNTLSFEMGHISSLDWTPKSEFAEVYLNGDYNGTYNITEKVEVKDNRVDLGDTGYLLEIDQLDRLDPDDVYFYSSRFLLNIKEPEVTQSSAEFNYIRDLINDFEAVLYGANFASATDGYAQFIDVDSFIDWYLISEITKNIDSKSYSSIYLNVMPGEKIKMGPLWDFDLSFGNVDYADSRYPVGFWVKDNPWYTRLFQDPAFVEKVKTRFAYYRANQDFILSKIDAYAEKLQWAQQENDDKWQTLGIYVWPNPVVFDTYQEEVDHLKSWHNTRMTWLETAFNAL